MKNTFFTLLILFFSVKLFAIESKLSLSNSVSSEAPSLSVATIASPMAADIRNDFSKSKQKEKPWKFALSQSRYTGNFRSIARAQGSGLSVGIERNLASFFSLGANYTIFKNEWLYTDDSPRVASDLHQLEGFLLISPFKFNFKEYSFVGSILSGIMNPRNFSQYVANYGFFYGANIELNYNHQLGIQLSSRVSTEYSSITSIGLTGYY